MTSRSEVLLLQEGWSTIYTTFKTSITIKTPTITRDSKGDPTRSYSNVSTYGVLDEVTEGYSEIGVGYIPTGKYVLYLQPTETISEGDVVTVGSTTYQVDRWSHILPEGTKIYIAVSLTKI